MSTITVGNLGVVMVNQTDGPPVAKVYGQTARDMRRLGRGFTTLFESYI